MTGKSNSEILSPRWLLKLLDQPLDASLCFGPAYAVA